MTEPTDPDEPMPRRPVEPSEQERLLHRRTIVARNLTIALCALVFVGLLLTVTYTVVTIRESQKTNTGTLNNSQRTLDVVQSCTTPGRDCYENGQKQTAAAVGDINRVVILAAACSSGLPAGLTIAERQTQIQACVIDRLSAARSTGP